MANHFLDQANQGRNEFWRYLLTVLAIIWLAVSSQLFVGAVALIFARTTDLYSLPAPSMLVVTMAPFPFTLLALWGGLRLLHKRSLMSIVNPYGRIFWGRVVFSALVWVALSAVSDVILSLAKPGDYIWSFELNKFLPYFLLSLVLIPIQTSTEEMVFRGYLTQATGRLTRRLWLPLLAPSIVFMLLHSFNPEVGAYGVLLTMPLYLGIGLLLAWLTLRSESLELALGLHAANNLYAGLVVTFPSSALPSPALFTMQKYDPVYGLAAFIVSAVVYLFVLYLLRRKWISPEKASHTQSEENIFTAG